MKSILSLIFRILLAALTVAAAVAEAFALFAPVVLPSEEISLTSIFTLVEPVLIAANLLLLLVWTVMWKRWAFIPLLMVLLSVWRIDSYFSVRFSRDYGYTATASQHKGEIRLMTYNAHMYGNGVNDNDSIIALCRRFDPDILCIEEYSPINGSAAKMASSLPKLKYAVSGKGKVLPLEKITASTVIFSRYPLIHPSTYGPDLGGGSPTVYADAVLDYGDTLRVFAVHLESTGYNHLSNTREFETYMADSTIDRNDIIGSLKSDSSRVKLKSKALQLVQRLSERSCKRSLEADTIRQLMDASPYRKLVMGDFNDTPYSYPVRTIISDDMADAFEKVPQNRYGYTYNRLHRMFRIDYILPQEDSYDVLDYSSEYYPWSDHNPVMATIKRKY